MSDDRWVWYCMNCYEDRTVDVSAYLEEQLPYDRQVIVGVTVVCPECNRVLASASQLVDLRI